MENLYKNSLFKRGIYMFLGLRKPLSPGKSLFITTTPHNSNHYLCGVIKKHQYVTYTTVQAE